MAEHPQEQEQEEPQSVAKLTTEIVVAYVTRNTIAPADLGDLIGAVGRALAVLGREQAEPVKPEPAVPVRRSIQDDHLVCLVCGEQHRTLRRHLDRQRSEMAKRVGLGHLRGRRPRSGA
jgi:predicted transcriptional regulator